MVISISPHDRDSKFNDLSTLTIKHRRGSVDTPNRTVDRHDLNAKDGIGADIPLTRKSKSFILQEVINPDKLDFVLNKNGYLGELFTKFQKIAGRLDQDSLIMLYPSLTKKALTKIRKTQRLPEFIGFFADLASHLGIESLIMSSFNDVKMVSNQVKRRNLQLIPILDIKEDTPVLTKEFGQCIKEEATDVPIIAFKFATYLKANKGYDLIMNNLEDIHDKEQAVMFVDVPRVPVQANYSAHHYAPFFMADLVAGRYYGNGFNPEEEKKVRLFCKNDLVAPKVYSKDKLKNKFDIDTEKEVFSSDKKLQDLLIRIAEDNTNAEDWKQNRPIYLSRVHENVRSREEFDVLQKNIGSTTTIDYLKEKKDMYRVVSAHLSQHTGRLSY